MAKMGQTNIERNIKCRLSVITQMNVSYSKFIALYRMLKASYQHMSQMILLALEKHNTNMQQSITHYSKNSVMTNINIYLILNKNFLHYLHFPSQPI